MAVDHLSVAILYYFISNNNLSNRFEVEIITDLNQITKTGWYSGGNIAQINQYILGGWNIINAAVQSDNSARISVFNKRGLVLEVTRDSDGSYTYFPLALKSDLSNVSNKLMLDGMKTLSVKWTNSDTLEFYVDNTRVFGILAKWSENYS